MWILEPHGNLRECDSGRMNLNLLWQQGNVYVMDNHLAAGWCWLNSLNRDEEYCFYHVDQHQDLCDNAPRAIIEPIRNNSITLEDYCGLSFELNGEMQKAFTWDNYIKQVQSFYPQWFTDCHFACHSCYNDSNCSNPLNITMYTDFFDLYESISCQVKGTGKKWIFNLDVDYFYKDGKQIATDYYISQVAEDIRHALPNLACITIALSPECCGGWNNAVRAYNIIAATLNIKKLSL